MCRRASSAYMRRSCCLMPPQTQAPRALKEGLLQVTVDSLNGMRA